MAHKFDCSCIIERVTERAILVDAGVDDHVWLPLSQVDVAGDLEEGAVVTVIMPQWLAEEKKLV